MNNKPAFEEKTAPKGGALLEFMRYYKPHLGTFTLDLCCALVISLVDILFPVITRKILYDYIPKRVFDYLPEEELQKTPIDTAAIVSDNYLKFLTQELKPFIDSHYPTRSEAAYTATAGSSAGGLISLYAICEYPEVFGAALCLSTHTPMALSESFEEMMADAPVWSKALRDYVENHLPATNSVKLYMDCGDQTLDAIYPMYQQKVDSLFTAHGWDEEHYMSKLFPGHLHDENSWKSRFDIPLTFIFGSR